MKKVVPTGEYILLEEVKFEPEKGEVLLAESARGDKKYRVLDLGNEADTEIDAGDIVFVQPINLIKIQPEGKEGLYMTKCEYIMGYEFKEEK